MVLAVGLLFCGLFWFSQEIYTALAAPLLKHLPGSQMIAIDVAAPFFIPFKLTLMLCVFLAVPYLLYQIWSFIAPGLYTHEKRLVVPMLVSSTGLFYLGVAFAYFVVFPLVFGFFTSVAPEGVTVSTDIGRYLDFVITLFFAFGIAFEVPVATVLVVAVGITTPENLVKIRPYVFVAAFIIGMFLTPPDMISQTLLAIPMWLLYEVGIVFSRTYKKRIKDAGLARDARIDGDTDTETQTTANESATSSANKAKSAASSSTNAVAAVATAGNAQTDGSETDEGAVASSADDAQSDGSETDEGAVASTANDVPTDDAETDEGAVASTDTESFFDPAIMQKPGPDGTFRNSLTDHDDLPESESDANKPSNKDSE